MPRYEAGGGFLLNDDVYDVLAVEVSGVAEEGLLVVVVFIGPEDEPGRVVSLRVDRNGLGERPARLKAREAFLMSSSL